MRLNASFADKEYSYVDMSTGVTFQNKNQNDNPRTVLIDSLTLIRLCSDKTKSAH